MMPKVAIAGRPNVGKSTLFNRILGERRAITEKTAGITRDKREEPANWRGYDFILMDTGGWSSKSEGGIESMVSDAALEAIKESDVIVMVVDSQTGMTANDLDMARMLTKLDKTILLAVNKVDDNSHKNRVWEFLSMGLGNPFPITALHGRGVADLLDEIVEILFSPDAVPPPDAELSDIDSQHSNTTPSSATSSTATSLSANEDFSVVIAGRPNAGKSTLFNKMVGKKRSIESPEPGTTMDPVDTLVETEVGIIRFVDTAGMRRQSRINKRAEYYSMLRALESVDRSDIALLIIDAKEGVTHQDQRLAERIDNAGCPILVLLNKWDQCSTEERMDLPRQVGKRLHFFKNAPLLRISALSGMGVDNIMPALEATLQAYKKRVSTREINDVIAKAQASHSAPGGARVRYAAQVASDPPTFILFANRKMPATYLRYLERELRDAFDFGNTPLKIRVKLRQN